MLGTEGIDWFLFTFCAQLPYLFTQARDGVISNKTSWMRDYLVFFTCNYLNWACSYCSSRVVFFFFPSFLMLVHWMLEQQIQTWWCQFVPFNASMFVGVYKKKNSNSEHHRCQPYQIHFQNSVVPQALPCWPLDLYLRVNLLINMWVWYKAFCHMLEFKPAVNNFILKTETKFPDTWKCL